METKTTMSIADILSFIGESQDLTDWGGSMSVTLNLNIKKLKGGWSETSDSDEQFSHRTAVQRCL